MLFAYDKWGFIDRNDNMVIPAKYDWAYWFEKGKGITKVELNGRIFFIDKNGNEVR